MRRLLLALGLFLGATFPALGQAEAPKPLTVDVLDVGQGDAILIRTPEGKTALIDAGPSKKVAELLRKRGVTGLDLLAISHHHQDHYGGAVEVVKRFKPRVFLASNSGHTMQNYLRLLEVVRDAGITAIAPTNRPRKIELPARAAGADVADLLPNLWGLSTIGPVAVERATGPREHRPAGR